MTGEPEPNWPRRAVEALIEEWRGFFIAARDMTLSPRRFAREWADGERRILNPLACGLNAFALDWVWRWGWQRALQYQLPQPVRVVDLSEPWVHLVLVVLVASLYHFPLRWMGSRRHWRTTVGALLYTAAGPWLLLQLLALPLTAILMKRHVSHGVALAALPMVLPQFAYYILPQMGAHRLSWWRAALAFAIYIALLMLIATVLLGMVVLPALKRHGLLSLPDMR